MSDLEITAIGGGDVDGPLHAELVELYDLSYREPPWNETDDDIAAYADRIRAWARHDTFTGLVARERAGGLLAGVAYGWFGPPESGGVPLPGVDVDLPFHVGDLMVHPLARRLGLGRHLIDQLVAGRWPAVLLTHPDSAARLLYESTGWRHTGDLDSAGGPTWSVYLLDAPTLAGGPAVASTTAPTSVLVCRGCCCGSERKHPDVDHAAQLDELRAALPAANRLWEVDCLGPCERSNVVVVRTGTRRRWFGGVLDPEVTTALAAWITSGPTGPPPEAVADLEFLPDDP